MQSKIENILKDYYELTEKDFYPAEDNRIIESGIEDITGGDNYTDYLNYYYSNYEDELFDN